MDIASKCNNLKLFSRNFNSITCKCILLLVIVLIFRAVLLPSLAQYRETEGNFNLSQTPYGIGNQKFIEVPQIVWGLNNQKIAFARACLTAKLLNRTLLMPSLSASLFYKEVDQLQPISFDKVFQYEKFNTLCKGFVQLGRYSDISNKTSVIELQKGMGRKWTGDKDLDQLKEYSNERFDEFEVIKVIGKNPFLWHDHWPVKDYASIFECLVLVEEILKESDRVVAKIREIGKSYVAVHMRIEIDWMIHCKKLEQRLHVNEICSSKEEIIERIGKIKMVGLKTPTVVYLAVADNLLEDSTILSGWKNGLIPMEKKKLGVEKFYEKYPYLIQAAIDYEVCLNADVFAGNSFSTFSSLVVLERTQKMIKTGVTNSCFADVTWPSYAYNIAGEFNGPHRWMTNMSDLSLQAISYGSSNISCSSS